MRNKRLRIIIVLVVVVAISIGWYFLAHKSVALAPVATITTPNTATINNISQGSTSAALPSPVINTAVWKTYRNQQYGFTLSYPNYLAAQTSQSANAFEANSAAERFTVTVINQPLDGVDFLTSDGIVEDSIFQFSASSSSWIYIGTDDTDPNGVLKFHYATSGPQYYYGDILTNEEYVPSLYQTAGGYVAWVGNDTKENGTQGGDVSQIAFIESPTKQFTIVVDMDQCWEYDNSCATGNDAKLKPVSTAQTIFSVIDTLQLAHQ
jgi:hypothetical protein